MGSIYGSVPKFNDVTDTLTVTGAAGNGADKLDNLSAIDIGTGPTDRNAQCVAIKSIYLRMSVYQDGLGVADLTFANALKMMEDVQFTILMVLDRQPNKAALTAALIWENPTDFKSPNNLDNRKRIKILKRWNGTFKAAQHTEMTTGSAVATPTGVRGSIVQTRKTFMKLKKPLKIEYDTSATTGVVGDIVDNAISLWMMVENWDVTYQTAGLALYCRTRFVSC